MFRVLRSDVRGAPYPWIPSQAGADSAKRDCGSQAPASLVSGERLRVASSVSGSEAGFACSGASWGVSTSMVIVATVPIGSWRVVVPEDDDWDIGFETKPTQDFDDADFIDLFGGAADDRRLALLRPVDETPFVAGQNETLDGFDAGREAESR